MTYPPTAVDRGAAAVKAVATHRVIGPSVVLVGVAAVAAGVWFANPLTPGGIIPPCPTNTLLHINCPGCGLSRAIDSLIHGDIVGALHFNAVGIALIVLAVAAYINYLVGQWRSRPTRNVFTHRFFPIAVVAVLVGWFIVRNIPLAPFSALKV